MKREGGKEHAEALGAAPKIPSAGRQATTQKLPQHRYARQTEAKSAGTRTLKPPRNPTGRQRQGHTGANGAYRRKRTATSTRSARDGTRSDRKRTAEATRQKTQTQSTNEPPKPRAKRTDARRDTHQTPPLGGTRHDRTKGRDARRTGHETPKARKRQKQSSKTQRHTPQRNRTTRTTNGREPRRAGATNRGDKRHKPHRATKSTKNADTAKNRKTRAKKMVVGGKLLRGGKLQARKRPF